MGRIYGRDTIYDPCTLYTVAALVSPEEISSLQVLVVGGESLTTEVRNLGQMQ
jgi:hypothetical protein